MNVYTDPRVLDVAAAMDALPTLSLDAGQPAVGEARATGTDHHSGDKSRRPDSTLTALLTVKPDKQCNSVTIADNWASESAFSGAKENPDKQSIYRGFAERRRPDSNRGCRICNPMP